MSAIRTPAVQLRMLERRAKVVDLVSQAVPYRQVAEMLDCSLKTVQNDLAEHWEETKPSSETTETLRRMQDDEYLQLRRRCYSLYESAEDVAQKLQVIDRINRISEHRRRLHGMDLERDVTINLLPSAESVAMLFSIEEGEIIEARGVIELDDGDASSAPTRGITPGGVGGDS